MSDTGRIDARDVAVRGALVALPLVLVRAGFRAAQDGYVDLELARLFARSIARQVLEGAALALVPALLFVWAVAALARRRAGTLAVGGLGLAGAALGLAFVSFRLPPDPLYAFGPDTLRGALAFGVGAGVALVAVLPALPSLRVPFAGALAALLPLAGVAAAVVLGWPAPAREARPNLILISLDTLRRDHLGCYGYDRATSPALDAFAARSLRFDNAFTVQPWTLTAHMSMLTGLLPSVHGITEETALPRGIPTLADLLGAEGYVTLGVADRVAYLSPTYGYGRGFDAYEQVPDDAGLKVDRILGMLDDVGEAPFFLFAHFYDAHSDWYRLPYEAEPDDLAELAPWYAGDDEAWCSGPDLCGSRMLLDMFHADERMEGEELERLIDLYDAGVRSLDRQLGRLFDELERRGRLEDTAILVTSDHGEEFFDHGKPLHGRCFDECLRVPFLLYVPGGDAGRSTDVLVSLLDVPATLLELAGAPPPETHQGMSLAPLARGEELPRARDAVVIEQIDGVRGLRGARWSLIPLGTDLLVFDQRTDPGQMTPLEGREIAVVRRKLRERLRAEEEAAELLRARFAAGAERVELSPAERALLQDLGYAGD